MEKEKVSVASVCKIHIMLVYKSHGDKTSRILALLLEGGQWSGLHSVRLILLFPVPAVQECRLFPSAVRPVSN